MNPAHMPQKMRELIEEMARLEAKQSLTGQERRRLTELRSLILSSSTLL